MLSLAQMLEDETFAAAGPEVLTGHAHLARPVRWVHASEQRDVAALLLGGEVVLGEGAELGEGVDDRSRCEYVESLAAAGVTALALELTPRFPAVPGALLGAAERLGFPVVALHRRVPFVRICQAVNTRLVDGSVERLREADRLSIALSDAAASSSGLEPLLDVIAQQVRGAAGVLDGAGELVARSGRIPARAGEEVADLSAGDRVVGSLHVRPAADVPTLTVAAVLDRAPDLLVLRLLQDRPASDAETLTAELFTLLTAPRRAGADRTGANALTVVRWRACLDRLLGPTGPGHAFLGVGVSVAGGWAVVEEVRQALLTAAPGAVFRLQGRQLRALLPFAGMDELDAARTPLRRRLTDLVAAHAEAAALLGTGSRRARLERETAAWTSTGGAPATCVDLRDVALEQFARRLQDRDALVDLADFTDEVLRGLPDLDDDLFATLVCFAQCWGNKTRTAAELGIGRQTLYLRLERVEAVIGPVDSTRERNAAIAAAVVLEEVRRRVVAGSGLADG